MSHCSSRARTQASLGETPPIKISVHAIGRYNSFMTSVFTDTPICLGARMWSGCYSKHSLRASSMVTATLLVVLMP
jgi:hypothetical protein